MSGVILSHQPEIDIILKPRRLSIEGNTLSTAFYCRLLSTLKNMFPSLLVATLALASNALGRQAIRPFPQSVFSNQEASAYSIPTIHESAIQARRVLHLENIGTLSTVFPSERPSLTIESNGVDLLENRPVGLGGAPIGLMDYYADCEDNGDPTILAISIATSFKNVDAGSNITMSLRWHPQDGQWRSAANLPRFSLIGHLETISAEEAKSKGLATCFVKSHPDSVAWLPGNRIHESHWTRLVVEHVYWIGGFGDRAYIGWIPTEVWKNVTKVEIDDCTLPGEKKKQSWGWREWL